MVGEEESHHAQFSLLANALISFESHLSVQLGKPAVLISILAIALDALDHGLHALSLAAQDECVQGIIFTLLTSVCDSSENQIVTGQTPALATGTGLGQVLLSGMRPKTSPVQ